MQTSAAHVETLSPWWKHAVILTLIGGFAVLMWLATQSYSEAPPIPETIQGPSGETLFTNTDIVQGQHVFLKYGLMDNGSIWGHGAYLGPDFSAAYLHHLVEDTRAFLTQQSSTPTSATSAVTPAVAAETSQLLKHNRYDPATRTLTFTVPEAMSFNRQLTVWRDYFAQPTHNRGLPSAYITDASELRQLTAFFAWTAWASVARRPGSSASYTNNFPYDPEVGNTCNAQKCCHVTTFSMDKTHVMLCSHGRERY
jgi:nitric oxide reductase subunit B